MHISLFDIAKTEMSRDSVWQVLLIFDGVGTQVSIFFTSLSLVCIR